MSDPSAAFIQNVSGSITIPNVTEVLRFAVDSNCFNNRTPAVTSAAGSNTSTDPTDRSNYGVQDGFIAGDLIWVPTGTTVTLGVGIDSEAVSSALNNIGPAATSALISQLNSSVALNYTQSGAPFSSQTSATLTKISRTLTAPLVIRLDNLSNTAIPVPPKYPTCILWYKFFASDAVGGQLFDYVSNSYNGTISNQVGNTPITYSTTTGKVYPSVATFNGTQVIRTTSKYTINQSAGFTFSAWLINLTGGGDPHLVFILDTGVNPHSNGALALYTMPGTNQSIFTSINSSTSGTPTISSNQNVTGTAFVTWRINTDYTVDYFINGTWYKNSGSNALSTSWSSFTGNIQIGNSTFGGWAGSGYSWGLADFRVFNSALTDSQVSSIYTTAFT